MFPPDPNEPGLIRWLRNPSVRRTLILTGLWLFSLGVLVWFRAVLLPFGLAVLIAFIIEPIVDWGAHKTIRDRRIPRIVVVLTVYAGVFLGVYLFGSFTLPQIGSEIAKFGKESSALIGKAEQYSMEGIDRVASLATRYAIPVERAELEGFLRHNLQEFSVSLGQNISNIFRFGRDVVAGTFRGVFGLFLVLMLTAFLSMDRTKIERFASSMVPPEAAESYRRILVGISSGLAGVVRGQVMICMTNGVLTFIGLWLLGVKFPIILATMAAVFSLIPIFGSIISTIPIVIIGLTDSLALGFLALLWIVGVHLLEANFLNPKIMGDAAKIHPVIVVFVLIVGEQTSGLIGALFAVPVASVVLTFFKFMHGWALESARRSLLPAPAPPATTAAAPPSNEPRSGAIGEV